MPILNVTNLSSSVINIQDALGYSDLSITLQGGASVTGKVISLLTLQAIEGQLQFFASTGAVTWYIEDDPESFADLGNPIPPWQGAIAITRTLYVRTTGVDAPGHGSLALPYRTVRYALARIPLNIPAGYRYVVNCTGIGAETFPDRYSTPAYKASVSLDQSITPDPLGRRGAGVRIVADLQLLSSISAADATVAGADGVLAQDAEDKMYKFTLTTPRASWATVVTGTGDSYAVTSGLVTLTGSAGTFTPTMVGNEITLVGSTTPANDGTYLVHSYVSPTQIKYINVNAVAEAFTGTWTVEIGKLNGCIWKAANTPGGDAVIAYNTTKTVYLTVSGIAGTSVPTFPATIMERTATFQGTSLASAGGMSPPSPFNIANCDTIAVSGINFINLGGPAEFCMSVRGNPASMAFSYCSFGSRVLVQGVGAYRQIWELSYFYGGWSPEWSGASLTINQCVFDGITGWDTQPGGGSLAVYNSIWRLSARPFGECRPLNAGNFSAPVNPVGGGLTVWTRAVRIMNVLANTVGNAAGAAILMNAGGELVDTSVRNCNCNAFVADRAKAPARLTSLKGSNNTGIGVVVSNNSVVDRAAATTVTGLGGDYKVGANATAAAGSWGAFTQENDLAAAGMTSQMCRMFTS